ncbi:bestrophin-4 [Fopius arisanus]|uniref:Bestrophin homolog n=4 Tax=Fopius arisanus TaxID=64838 RepID=A0A9R1TWH0_9HYME|nr:PREDICTED: bestrophin-4-like [Fopius arisanus]XP_011298636.1 PREDICTED: bestrophin-4-like [Fopius arisanus]XP_011298637.1 PREDICTED: bestrophin-4-like [Fopius arisanus]
MTVSYQYEVASSTSGGFTRLLFMWRGSLYKLIYRELLLFCVLFVAISAIYRHLFDDTYKEKFEALVIYCDTFISLIPLSFVLGFYVAYVAQRWWQQYMAIPWPDKVMHSVALYVTGNDDYGRMLRRSLMRYLNLSLILVLRSISSAVKRRFPTLDHVVDSGFMTSLELELFLSVPSVEFNTYWIPCTWFINLLKEARRTHRLPDAQGLKIVMEEFNDFRSKCGLLWSYDWVSIPLVYTQVVTLATYSFFVVALIGRQYIKGDKKPFQMELDQYLPIFTILQFFFYMGLLKVAEQLINPFGDDDEDFELNWLIDRHTKVSYLGVDTLMNRCPPLVKDIYWDSEDLTLPYTEAAAAYKRKTYRGSVANMMVPEEKQTMFLPEITEEEESEQQTPTPRTSTASLATHPNDSPLNGKRQIIGNPSASKVSRNYSETVIPLDIHEFNEIEGQPVSSAQKKSSKLTPKSERRRFFPFSQKPQPSIRPWPSATNLEESTLTYPSTKDNGESTTDHSLSIQSPPPYITVRSGSQDDPSEEPQGFFNSAFSQELSEDLSELNDVSIKNANESPKTRSAPKFLVRRQGSVGSGRKRKGIRWKRPLDTHVSRRRTVDCIPSAKKIISQTSSTPDLKSFTVCDHRDVFVQKRAVSEETET